MAPSGFNGRISSDHLDASPTQAEEEELSDPAPEIADYESIRNATILENKARMASLGIHRKVEEIQAFVLPPKSKKKGKKRKPVGAPRQSERLKGNHVGAPRQSERLKGNHVGAPRQSERLKGNHIGAPRQSERLKGNPGCSVASYPIDHCGEKRHFYDGVVGIFCHQCKRRNLCREEDCKRCGDRDINQQCIGKTECSTCHSLNGVMCRACLKSRYGEELEEVRKNKEWMCPHCIEEKGINPYWICNSPLCLKKRKMGPTRCAIFRARKKGYKSLAHLLMNKLKRNAARGLDPEAEGSGASSPSKKSSL